MNPTKTREWTIVREPDPDEEDRDRWIASIREGIIEVARVGVYGIDTPSHRNALLLAAAPDLAAACEAALPFYEACDDPRANRVVGLLRRALAKSGSR